MKKPGLYLIQDKLKTNMTCPQKKLETFNTHRFNKMSKISPKRLKKHKLIMNKRHCKILNLQGLMMKKRGRSRRLLDKHKHPYFKSLKDHKKLIIEPTHSLSTERYYPKKEYKDKHFIRDILTDRDDKEHSRNVEDCQIGNFSLSATQVGCSQRDRTSIGQYQTFSTNLKICGRGIKDVKDQIKDYQKKIEFQKFKELSNSMTENDRGISRLHRLLLDTSRLLEPKIKTPGRRNINFADHGERNIVFSSTGISKMIFQ
ncbi:unnamed protein product [Moneuplotes crassus]|uniref:Uncharacterized protein n=1 Tax=Euplotes crassus TaxID=5936 RepID=A0AAD1UNY1_EUPCR|nr:unnamed protein product [Moneuplotes crassus]